MKADASFLLENAAWPAFCVEASGTIRHANQAAIAWFGPKLEGETVSLSAVWADSTETAEQFLARWERSPAPVTPMRFRSKGGGVAQFAAHICPTRESQRRYVFQLMPEQAASPAPAREPAPAPGGGVEQTSDGGARSQGSESVLALKQKFECALQLARNVAREFNNALTGVLGHSSFLLSQAEREHPWRASLLEIEKAGHRATEITQQLAVFGRPEKDNDARSAGNLNALLRRLVETLQQTHASKVSWTLQLEPQLYAPKYDEAKIQQVFNKVLENSLEAMGDAGRITISTWNFEVKETTQDGTAQLNAGSYAGVEIADDGPGIEASVLPRIFEPFFTTKEGHRGLGLAWVYGIVTNHRGGVTVFSQPGQGTLARIYLPATRRLVADTGTGSLLDDLRGSQTILMVDDEELLLTMGQVVLGSFGYHVLTANSGLRALEVIGQSSTPIDLVITDLVMPQMSGHELIEQVQLRLPGVPVLCLSGLTRTGDPDANESFLPKPFSSQELLTRVRQLLTPRLDA